MRMKVGCKEFEAMAENLSELQNEIKQEFEWTDIAVCNKDRKEMRYDDTIKGKPICTIDTRQDGEMKCAFR
jgi:hypothetical protein